MAASNLTLVLPPLSFSDSENHKFKSLLNDNAKSLSSLRNILVRGEIDSYATQEIILTELFGLPYKDIDELPVAAITAMGSGFDAATGYWLHAEPVHLHPDLDHVLLFDSSHFELTKNELGQLAEELQEVLEESELTPRFGQKNNFFIRTHDEPKAKFTALNDVTGKNILQHLPEGEDSARWRLLQNEIQMQMTQCIVNRRREEKGEMTVNGLWFWGGGYLLRGKYKRCYETVISNQLFVTGLAVMTDAIMDKKINSFDDVDNKTLVTIEQSKAVTPAVSLIMLLEFERQWLKPALAGIKSGDLESLTLVTGKAKTVLTQKMNKRFWKRPVQISTLLNLLS